MEKDKSSVNVVKSIISIIVWFVFIGVVLNGIVFLSDWIDLSFPDDKLTDLISAVNIFSTVAIIFSMCISYSLKDISRIFYDAFIEVKFDKTVYYKDIIIVQSIQKMNLYVGLIFMFVESIIGWQYWGAKPDKLTIYPILMLVCAAINSVFFVILINFCIFCPIEHRLKSKFNRN